SDEVNPHGLPPDQLTQPGELSAALLATPGLKLEGIEPVVEIATDQIEQATARLALLPGDPAAFDVLIYFAHRIPNGADANARQEAFVDAVESFLEAGGGVVSFHHGIYLTAGKASMQAVLGGEATGAVVWDTVEGQNVIDVAPGHPITTFGLAYTGTRPYADPALGIPAGDYAFFNNTPDERYPFFELLPDAGTVVPLFASDYEQNGDTHLLGYVHRRPSWAGPVVVYQPGEHEPTALGPGNNFQILLSSIVFATLEGHPSWIYGDGFEDGSTDGWSDAIP
ncbi:MAG: ThuA domain-containing protein, partial [Holophagales bacterium]|nr:ThuA domain-containing protein [Holophagales bacterium]